MAAAVVTTATGNLKSKALPQGPEKPTKDKSRREASRKSGASFLIQRNYERIKVRDSKVNGNHAVFRQVSVADREHQAVQRGVEEDARPIQLRLRRLDISSQNAKGIGSIR